MAREQKWIFCLASRDLHVMNQQTMCMKILLLPCNSGYVAASGYSYGDSKGMKGGKFFGLLLDQVPWKWIRRVFHVL